MNLPRPPVPMLPQASAPEPSSALSRSIACGSLARGTQSSEHPTGPMSGAFRIETVGDTTAFAGLQAQWSRLVPHVANASTFLTPEWLLSWWEAYQPPAKLSILGAYRNDELVGVAPLMIVREKRLGVPMRCLRFVGDGSSETDHMDFVLRTDLADPVRAALLDAIEQQPWDLAVLSNMPEQSATVAQLAPWAAGRGYRLAASAAACPMRRLPDTYESLLASMPSRFRTSVRSTRRKLATEHRVEFGLHDDPARFAEALDALFVNHESRWRARGQSGVFANEKRRDFYQRLTPRLHAAGALRFFYLRLDDRIAAQEYCFAHDGVVYLLQEGFDFELARLNVGNALRGHVFEYLIAHRYRAYDFLAGVSRHKLNWADSTPNDVTLTIGRDSVRGWFGVQGPTIVESLKDRLRPLRDRMRRLGSGPVPQAPSESAES
jgi:CelD/BcsL family acetyltransferase involved in cellulose biosynthesis